MQSLSKYKREIKHLLCEIDLFSKYAWVVPLKDKKGIIIANAFQKIISKERKPNKIWLIQYYKYNNTVHRTIKMKPIDVTSDSCAEYNEDSNEKDPKFKVGDHVRISKYKNIFAKGYTKNWSEEVFLLEKLKAQFRALTLLVT